MVKKKKILFFVYCLLVSALSIGWYPQNQNKQVRKDITSVRKSSEKMAALVENNQFCYQGVAETDMDESNCEIPGESGSWGEKDFREDCGG